MKTKFILFLILIFTLFSLLGCGVQVEYDTIYKAEVDVQNNDRFALTSQSQVEAQVTNLTMSGVITVYSEYYTQLLGITVSGKEISQGSGGIFHYQDGVYYALTNCHVVNYEPSYNAQRIYVLDYLGNRYDASIYKNPQLNVNAISADYDLAVICFEAEEGLFDFDFSEDDAGIGEAIALLGSPAGVRNQIRFGDIKRKTVVTFDEETANDINVQFDIMLYDILSQKGSSGGPLLNYDLDMVGVHFCGTEQASNPDSSYGGAVPISKVREFLDIYAWI